MGFDDKDFEKAEKVNSNTQLYKQAGNSIVVNVLERILENLIDKKEHIRIIELFGGIGACSKALERIGIDYEIADYVEIDKYAVKSFNAIHDTNFEPQDICEWDKNIDVDLIMHGSPCFTKDSLVLTADGYKYINEVKKGDKVLTHNNRYKEVINTFDNGVHDIYKINAMGVDEIKATSNHKFYVREMYKKGHIPKRYFKEPTWKELKYLSKKDYLGVPINQYSIIPEFKNLDTNNGLFWWIIGRYFGDGWYKSDNSIIICCGKTELDEIASKIDGYYDYKVYEERTTYKVYINEKDIGEFILQFGRGAINKTINNVIMNLPIDLLEEFLKGYFSADGCKIGNIYKATSISRQLVYGMGMCIAKVYHTPYRIYKCVRPKKYIIEGREVNQHDTYQIVFKKEKCKQDKAFYEDNYIWYPIKDITYIGEENVYDIEVENDHSFTIQNTIVHNCQDFSLAGKQAGGDEGSGTRSSLMYETIRIVEKLKPKYVIWENVKNVISKKHKHNFDNYLNKMEELGYKNYWQVLNAKDYGIPQNRERVFTISILSGYDYQFPNGNKNDNQIKRLFNFSARHDCRVVYDKDGLCPTLVAGMGEGGGKVPMFIEKTFEFPPKQELKLKLKDMLEDNVDEKYYLSDEQINNIKKSTFHQNNRRIQEKEYTDTLCVRDWKDPKCVQVATLPYYNYESDGRVYSPSGISPCLRSKEPNQKIDEQDCILDKNATKQGYLEATEGDGIDISSRMQYHRGNVQKDSIQTITTSGGNDRGVVVRDKIDLSCLD